MGLCKRENRLTIPPACFLPLVHSKDGNDRSGISRLSSLPDAGKIDLKAGLGSGFLSSCCLFASGSADGSAAGATAGSTAGSAGADGSGVKDGGTEAARELRLVEPVVT